MGDEIVNRVAKSPLVTFDLEAYYPEGPRVLLDISQWLYEGLILRENEFRSAIRQLTVAHYQNAYVALHCSTDAIVPGWAYMLVATALEPVAKKVVVGSLNDLETVLYTEIIQHIEVSDFEGKPVIIKGCTQKPVPQSAYVLLSQKLAPVAKKILYGEACSSVPISKI